LKRVFLIAFFISIFQLTFGQTEQEYYSKLLNTYKFEKYPVDIKCELGSIPDSITWGELAELPNDIKTNILTQFRTSDNFIGSCYKYVSWDCGSPCQMIAIFRINSGELVGTLSSSLGFLIQPNSRLIVLNPPSKQKIDIEYRQLVGQPQFYELWNNKLLKIGE